MIHRPMMSRPLPLTGAITAIAIALALSLTTMGLTANVTAGESTAVAGVSVPAELANVMALEVDANSVAEIELLSSLEPDAARQALGERDGVTLVNFWATWCAPCKEEMPHLEALAEELNSEGLSVLAVSVDRSEAGARAYMDEMGYDDLELLFDRRMASFRSLGGRGVPYTALINQDGELVASLSGTRDWSSPETLAFMRLFLDGNS